MDADSRKAVQLLETLAGCRTRLVDLARRLRECPHVLGVDDTLRFLAYGPESVLQGYVEAELKNGKVVCWYLEISWSGEKWMVDTRVLLDEGQQQQTMHAFPERAATGFDEFLDVVVAATRDLVGFDALGVKGVSD